MKRVIFFFPFFSSVVFFLASFGQGSWFASSDICSVHSCEAWGQTQRSTKRLYLPQLVSEARRPSWNVQLGRGWCNTQSSTHHMQSALTLYGRFSWCFRCRSLLATYPSNSRVKQIRTAALPMVPKSQIPWSAAATLWLKRGTTRLQVSEPGTGPVGAPHSQFAQVRRRMLVLKRIKLESY